MNQPLDVFGQQPGLNKLYTQLCLCFPLHTAFRDTVVQDLREGLHHLVTSVPWLAGEVICDGESGRYIIRPGGDTPMMTIKDCSTELPAMTDFQTAECPATLLHEKLIAPCETIRTNTGQPAPVFMVQANFINGGLLLVVCGLHSCMDMAGQGYIIYLLAKACRIEVLSDKEVNSASLRGSDVIPLLNEDELARRTHRPADDTITKPTPRPASQDENALWTYVTFSGPNLARLKSKATESMTTDFVSSDDCLSAFLWQSITRARLARLSDTVVESAFTRTVDAREAAGIAPTYTGNAAVKVAFRMSVQELLDASVGVIASRLREGLNDVGYRLRLEATLLSQGIAPNRPSVEPSTGVNLSSWAKEKTYELDFGQLLGKPEAVRRPTFQAWESLVYLIPKREDGEIGVALCLRDEDLGRLKEDVVFTEYGHFVD